ncbi:hypothetical protein LTR53_006442 [Teratosphaeriaceae sp. CCFEE 6253]|nr:hypothetical protein LTR53_006442 [Teratosphaeriaceae sp. CCFEE 6253]
MAGIERALNSSSSQAPTRASTSALDRAYFEQNGVAGDQQLPPKLPVQDSDGTTTLNLSASLGAFPGASVTRPAVLPTGQEDSRLADPVSQQILTLDVAEVYFAFYKRQLDPFLHYNLINDTMTGIRSRSPFLLTAVVTVAAFCLDCHFFNACFELFKSQVSHKLFADKYDFDDVRALCIGSLWLGDISATLNGLAVRIGTQLDLHRCITKMPHIKQACCERTRLYFLVYVCDHHCSLVYGRPPMTREWKSLKIPRTFLHSAHSRPMDIGLISHVELWAISRRVFEQFGADVESAAVSGQTAEMLQLGEAYDRWQIDWRDATSVTAQICPHYEIQRVFDLYYHSAKLHLYSHAYRGPNHGAQPLAEVRATHPLAEYVLDSAIALLTRTLDGRDTSTRLHKLPAYFGTMIAYASVCLIRAGIRAEETEETRKKQCQDLITRLAAALRSASLPATHPLSGIAKGLETVTGSRPADVDGRSPRQSAGDMDETGLGHDAFAEDDFDWNLFASDDYWAQYPDEMGGSEAHSH